jgi:tetratricopeptide (TPR) repeat protein
LKANFSDIEEFFRALLGQTACPNEEIEEASGAYELMKLAVEHLKMFKFLLIVDDLDTLGDEDQSRLHQLLVQLCSRSEAKAIITARRNLSLPEGDFLAVEGLPETDFRIFVGERCKLLSISPPTGSLMRGLMRVTGGSPLFALSILRLVAEDGSQLDQAISRWRGADGEKVRNAAFSREVDRLKEFEARTLLASAYLSPTSKVELAAVLRLNEFETTEAIQTLRQFSMIATQTDLPGGARLVIPDAVAAMINIVEQRVSGYEAIKVKCAKQREISADPEPYLRDALTRTIAFLKRANPEEALDTVRAAMANLPEHYDLFYLLGKCYLEANPVAPTESEEAFQAAFDRGCRRQDLFESWLRLRGLRENWDGVIKLSQLAERERGVNNRFVISRAEAYTKIAEQYERSTEFEQAVSIYDKAIEDFKSVLQIAGSSHFAGEIKAAQRRLIQRRLAVIKEIAERANRPRKYFRDVVSTAKTYAFFDRNALLSGLEAFSQTIDSVEGKARISTLDITNANTDLRLSKDLLSTMRYDEKLKAEIARIIDALSARISHLATAEASGRH